MSLDDSPCLRWFLRVLVLIGFTVILVGTFSLYHSGLWTSLWTWRVCFSVFDRRRHLPVLFHLRKEEKGDSHRGVVPCHRCTYFELSHAYRSLK